MTRLALSFLATVFLSLFQCGFAVAAPAVLTPAELRCEGRANPSGIDFIQPALAWKVQATNASLRGLSQRAYQVLVASTAELLAQDRGDLWDSGQVKSAETQRILYAGKPLGSGQRVFWKVRVWDQDKRRSAWSDAADWTMGVLAEADWNGAQWIAVADTNAASQLLRREFAVRGDLVRAVVHGSGLGQYELSLNGVKVGTDLLTPGWTDYRKTVLYDTYDVTAQLKAGSNVIGMTLGNGMYSVTRTTGRYNKFSGRMGSPKAIALLRLEYTGGQVEFVRTDSQWQARSGPLTYSDVYGGEDFDARLYPEGWDQSGFNNSEWVAATEQPAPTGRLTGLSGAGWPIRVIETLTPASQQEIRPGVIVYDFGQNAMVMPRLKVVGAKGDVVKIIPAELRKTSGEIDDPMCGGRSFWTYTLAGKETETWTPKFFYRGARYLQAELRPAETNGPAPRVVSLVADVVHAAAPATGTFQTSSDLFNRIHTLVRWAQRGNMMSVLTDCPHREKLGWLEQDYLNGPALRYNFDLNPLFAKIVNDIQDAQQPDGLVPNIAPEYTVFGWWDDMQFRETPEWGSAFIQIAWQQFLFTGDLDLARRYYDGMKRYLAYLQTRVGADGILRIKGSLGDWYDIGPKDPGRAQLTPVDLTATAIYFDDLQIMARFATQTGRVEDANNFRAQAAQILSAFQREYFLADKGVYATGSQTANAMPFALGMVAPEQRARVLEAIVADVSKNGLTAGDVGYRYLLRALADGGRSEVVFAMNHQSEKPGYGYQLKMGATSLTEAWDARRRSSQNHFMLGQINEWFFHDLAGIQPDPTAPGFKHILIKPAVVKDLGWVKASYESVHGLIRSEWRYKGTLELNVVVPPNTTATVFVPTTKPAAVQEGGRSARRSKGVRFVRAEGGRAVYAVGSGEYRFTAPE
jgi:alpha-L-rhamnosidase